MNDAVRKLVETADKVKDKVLEVATGLTAEQRQQGGGGTVELHPQGYSPGQDTDFKRI